LVSEIGKQWFETVHFFRFKIVDPGLELLLAFRDILGSFVLVLKFVIKAVFKLLYGNAGLL